MVYSYCFHTFKNIRVCQRGNASKAVDRFSTAMVSRDLSRLRTSRAIMLCGKEHAINACWLLRTFASLHTSALGVLDVARITYISAFHYTYIDNIPNRSNSICQEENFSFFEDSKNDPTIITLLPLNHSFDFWAIVNINCKLPSSLA